MVTALFPCLGTAAPSSATSASQKLRPTYLERVTEWLNPETVSAHERNQTLWKTAMCAYVIAVAALVAMCIFCKFVLPPGPSTIGTMLIFGGVIGFLGAAAPHFFEKIQAFVEQEEALAEQARQRAQIRAYLPKNDNDLLQTLGELGIQQTPNGNTTLQDLRKLSPLVANYGYWQQKVKEKNEEILSLSEEAQKLYDEPNRDLYKDASLEVVAAEKAKGKVLLHRAFAYAMVHRPYFLGEGLEDLRYFLPPSLVNTMDHGERVCVNTGVGQIQEDMQALVLGRLIIDTVDRAHFSPLHGRLSI